MKIEVKDMSKKFNDKMVLENLNIEFESGKIYGLLGPNGSGKSVFLKMLCGYYEPSSGRILLNGKDICRKKIFSTRKRELIENSKFFPNMTGYDNLKLVTKIKREISDDDIFISLKNLNMLDIKDQKYKEYSDGMKQKLSIAKILMENPKVVILDEPFKGLDGKNKEEIMSMLKYNVSFDQDNNVLFSYYSERIIIIATTSKRDLEGIADIIYEFKDCNVYKA